MKSQASTTYLKKTGFTLVELLVSISILSIILLTLAQAIGYVSQLWVNGIGTVDNYTKARNILSIMDRDIQEMVMRPDTAAFVNSNVTTPGPACAFYTNVQGSPGADTRTVSLVQYLLNPTGGATATAQTTLGRLNYGMNFTSGITPWITNPMPTLPSLPALAQLPAPTTANTDTLATGVIQFQWQFVDGSGNILTPPYTYTYVPVGSTTTQQTQTPFTYNYTVPSASSNPRAIIISVLVLSNSAFQLATQNTATMTRLQTDFNTTLPNGPSGVPIETYSQYWNGILNPTAGVLDTTLPAPVRSGLKVFQRYVPLPVTAP